MRVYKADEIFARELTPEEEAKLRQMKPSNGRIDLMDSTPSELVIFTPDEIQRALDKNLAAGLRQLADAIEAGAIDGKLIDCKGHGLGPKNDDRAHLLLRVDLAAPIRREKLESGYGVNHGGKVFSGDLPALEERSELEPPRKRERD